MQSLPGDRVIQSDAVVNGVRFTGDGTMLAGICNDGNLRVWDAASGELKRTQPLEKANRATALVHPGLLSAVATDGSVKFWDPKSGAVTRETKPLKYMGGRLGVAPDLGKFAAVSRIDPTAIDEAIHVWDAEGRELFTAASGFGGASAIAFSPSGSILASASYDADVRVWSTRNGELVHLISELTVAMFAAAFSPDEKVLALAGADRVLYLYDAKTWKLVRKITGQPEMIASLAFSPDGRRIVTGGFDVITEKHPVHVIIWDTGSGKPVRTMKAPHVVRSVAFAPNGGLGANVNSDKTVSVWGVPKA